MNDSNSMLRFRESFRGYNKDDVNAYIEQVNARFSRRESDLRAQIADLQNRMQVPAANTADDGTKKRLEAAETENAKLKAELESMGASVIITRYDNASGITFRGRMALMRNESPDLCISIHHDSSTAPTVNGFGAFHSTVFSKKAAEFI